MTREEINNLSVKARFIRRKYLEGKYTEEDLDLFVEVNYITAEEAEAFRADKKALEDAKKKVNQ